MSAATARRYLLGGALLSLLTSTHAFYLPGAAPRDYYQGEPVNLFVNALTPMLAGTEHAKLVSTLLIYGPKYEVHDARPKKSLINCTLLCLALTLRQYDDGSKQMIITIRSSISASQRVGHAANRNR